MKALRPQLAPCSPLQRIVSVIFPVLSLLFPLLIASLLASPALAQQSLGAYTDGHPLPDSPVGRRARDLFEVLNVAHPPHVRSLMVSAFDPESWADMTADERYAWFMGVRQRHGVLQIHGARHFESGVRDNELVLLLVGRASEQWLAAHMSVDPDPPHLIQSFTLMPARPPEKAVSKLSGMQDVVRELSSYLDRQAEADRFSGAVLLAKDGDVLLRKAYGQASKAYGVANAPDTEFAIASLNKMFTAVAIMRLVEDGKLSLGESVGKFLDDGWLDPAVAASITIEHLLTHTSGLGNYMTDEWREGSPLRFARWQDYKPLIAAQKTAFAPGQGWQYSNAGYFLLGLVIERVSGRPYEDHVREHVYAPAGMRNTAFHASDDVVPNVATGYIKAPGRQPSGYRENVLVVGYSGTAAGGGYSTVDDLFAFAKALRIEKLLPKSRLESMWTATPASQKVLSYGMGFEVRQTPSGRVIGHQGGHHGMSSVLAMHEGHGVTLAVLSNYDAAAQMVSGQLDALLSRVGTVPAAPAASTAP